MPTLLVLGAKPDPALPWAGGFDAVACANASVYSAARLGLPVPVFTVMTALLTDGSEAGRRRIEALAGLRTERLIYYPRPVKGRTPFRRLLHRLKMLRMRAAVLKRELARVGFRWESFEERPNEHYRALICQLCGDAPEVGAQLARKQASSGVVAAAVGLADGSWDRLILAGFNFELTQAFGEDPNIRARGAVQSLHRDTDVLVLHHLARRCPLVTTEPAVHAAAGVPLVPSDS
ncbi:MAG TPA: hypothetical protein VFG43_09615 [Geminicoccaceae bacterium]|nr:hypothetical protein [Geminicoccaceae bacterium]